MIIGLCGDTQINRIYGVKWWNDSTYTSFHRSTNSVIQQSDMKLVGGRKKNT